MNFVLILVIAIFTLILVLIFGGAGERKKRREYEREYERRERETKKILKEKNRKAKKESRKYIDLFEDEDEQNKVIKTGITTDAKKQNEINPEWVNDILNEKHDENKGQDELLTMVDDIINEDDDGEQEDLWTENFEEPSNFVDKPKELWNEKTVWDYPDHKQEDELTHEETPPEVEQIEQIQVDEPENAEDPEIQPEVELDQEETQPEIEMVQEEVQPEPEPMTQQQPETNYEEPTGDTFEFNSDLFGDSFNNDDNNQNQ